MGIYGGIGGCMACITLRQAGCSVSDGCKERRNKAGGGTRLASKGTGVKAGGKVVSVMRYPLQQQPVALRSLGMAPPAQVGKGRHTDRGSFGHETA